VKDNFALHQIENPLEYHIKEYDNNPQRKEYIQNKEKIDSKLKNKWM